MLIRANDIVDGSCMQAAICIVGGGAAGITIARTLAQKNVDVILVAGGGARETALDRDLYAGLVTPPHTHEPLQENRIRAWGGSTVAWGGRCVPYDEVDFRERDWIPHSGWPVSYDDMAPYVREACEICEAGPPVFDARLAFPEAQPELIAGIDDDDLDTWSLERWSPPTNFAARYGPDLRRSPTTRIVLDGHVIQLAVTPSGRLVSHAVVAHSPSRRFEIRAGTFVLAAGGLENPRLLLASNDTVTAGLGNDHDLVGRFYQSHRFGVCGEAAFTDPSRGFIYEFERDAMGVYCRRRFRLTESAQRQRRVGNAIAFFARPGAGAAVHRNAVTSSVYLAKALVHAAKGGPINALRHLTRDRAALLEHAAVVLTDGARSAPDLWRLAVARFGSRRRLPSILPPRHLNRFHLYYQTEHAPNRESRVMLSRERDALGMPRLAVSVAFSPVDFRTVREFYDVFAERFRATGAGSFVMPDDMLESQLDPAGHGFNSNAHHIGTTRMARTPQDGVVDVDCRVHGMENLYVAGSSVFPTSSHANPTLMIVALALRLARHLGVHARP